MKKFTILLATIATLFSASLFTACSEEESNDPTIVGTWEYSENDGDKILTITFTFNKDGSGSGTNTLKIGGMIETNTIVFEYVYNETTKALTLIGGDNVYFAEKMEAFVTANKLRLVMYYGDNYEYSETMTFTRK